MLISSGLRALLWRQSDRWASTAANKSKAAPQKQQFRKRQKDAHARASASTPTSQREALTSALFEVTNEKEPGEGCLDERAVISKAWSRMQMLRLHAQCKWERAFCQSKIDAMAELSNASPDLAAKAFEVDYGIPPLHRRIPTDTPPEPSKFPFVMQRADE